MVRTAPVIAVLFFVPAMSLAGIPPMSGFAAKFALVGSAAASRQWWILGVAVVVSLLTLFSVAKIWIGAFWAESQDGRARSNEAVVVEARHAPALMLGPTAVLVLATVALGVMAGPLYDYCVRAATDLVDPSTYVSVVLGEGG
jgi:multicomponent Na+:H+ antiporter subunit D